MCAAFSGSCTIMHLPCISAATITALHLGVSGAITNFPNCVYVLTHRNLFSQVCTRFAENAKCVSNVCRGTDSDILNWKYNN